MWTFLFLEYNSVLQNGYGQPSHFPYFSEFPNDYTAPLILSGFNYYQAPSILLCVLK